MSSTPRVHCSKLHIRELVGLQRNSSLAKPYQVRQVRRIVLGSVDIYVITSADVSFRTQMCHSERREESRILALWLAHQILHSVQNDMTRTVQNDTTGSR